MRGRNAHKGTRPCELLGVLRVIDRAQTNIKQMTLSLHPLSFPFQFFLVFLENSVRGSFLIKT